MIVKSLRSIVFICLVTFVGQTQCYSTSHYYIKKKPDTVGTRIVRSLCDACDEVCQDIGPYTLAFLAGLFAGSHGRCEHRHRYYGSPHASVVVYSSDWDHPCTGSQLLACGIASLFAYEALTYLFDCNDHVVY